MPRTSERELTRALARYAVLVRTVVIVPCGVLGVVAAPAGQRAVTALAVAVAAGWCLVRHLWQRGGRPRTGRVVGLQVLATSLVGMSQLASGPQPVDSWVFVLAALTAATTQFEWSTRPLPAAALSAQAIGCYGLGHALAGGDAAAALLPMMRMAVEAVLARAACLLLRAGARAADRRAERLAALRREAALADARRAGEREYLATLHDTASATLLMASSGVGVGDGHREWLPERARRDLEILATVPRPRAGTRDVDLAGLLASVAGAWHGLRLVTELRGPLPLPEGPAFGILHGVREAVSNVERHAGVAEATLTAGQDADGRAVVELRDDGRGFRPEEVPAHRRGVSGSVRRRMADVGGVATVSSRPGRGTTVRWMWPDD